MRTCRNALTLSIVLVLATSFAVAQRDQSERPKKEYPAQASVATKQAFGTISPASPEVASAIEATDLAALRKKIGKRAAFKGKVVKVYTSRSNSIVILNFARNYKEAAVAVLKPEHYARFPSMETLKDQNVLVTGKVVTYEDRPEIELVRPDQVRIIR
ncbi:MAG: hypothetical protein RMJ43_01920 [Chloroherpetonaceae bacterium]|nr:hypothetical protein [Chthonomonadaceae bacterium]MDW8206565.1 hypothetical protein [Chloroherpetonaceae bacterium]